MAAAQLTLLLPTACRRVNSFQEPPNVVILIADSLRASSLPMYGNERNLAPFLRELAARSTLFRRCYSTATWTRPAVTGILSGLHLLQHLQWTFDKSYPEEIPSLPRLMAQQGYTTGFFTANHAVGKGYGMENHFHHVSHEAASEADFGPRLTRDCMAWLEGTGTDPVFAYVHYYPPHGPYDPPERFLGATRKDGRPARTVQTHRELEISLGGASAGRIPFYQALPFFSHWPRTYSEAYEANVRYADFLLADFLAEWELRRGGERSVFLITADHGECLERHERWFDHGRTLANQILHVPLLIHDTGRPEGAIVDTPVSHLDLGETALRLAGASKPFSPHGSDLLGSHRRGRTIVSQIGEAHQEGGWALTRDRWRLTYNDCPRDGLARICRILADPLDPPLPRLPVPRPVTGSTTSIALDEQVELLSFALDGAYLIAGRATGLTVRLRSTDGSDRIGPGSFELRWHVADAPGPTLGTEPVEDGECTFRGEMPPLTAPRRDGTPDVEIEARWVTGGSEGAWIPVLSIPLLSPRDMAPGIWLLGIIADRKTVRPGESVRLTYVWEVDHIPDRETAIAVFLRGSDGSVATNNHHLFFNDDLARSNEDKSTLKPVVDPWKMRHYEIGERRLRFDETFWMTVPPDVRPDDYQIEVGLFDFGSFDPGQPESLQRLPGHSPFQSLTVVSTRRQAVNRAIAQRQISDALRLLGESDNSVLDDATARQVEMWARQRSDQGHFWFLLAQRSQGVARRRCLSRCLRQTPFHRAALAEVSGWSSDTATEWRKRWSRLTPEHELDIRFAPGIQLYGMRIERADSDPESLYVTLFWLSTMEGGVVYSGELFAGVDTPGQETPVRVNTWWYLGGRVRPTQDWRIGEAVVETIRLPGVPQAGRLSLDLRITERWNEVYSGGRYRTSVPVLAPGTAEPPTIASLGTFDLAGASIAEGEPMRERRHDPAQYQLYDLEADAEETSDLVERRPEIFESMRADLLEMLRLQDLSEQFSGSDDENLPEETKRQLEALGYVT